MHTFLKRTVIQGMAICAAVGCLAGLASAESWYAEPTYTVMSACPTPWTSCPSNMDLRCRDGRWECVLPLTPLRPAAPVITRLTPASGGAGTSVTIEGSGFSPTGNTVYFGDSIFANIASPDRRHLTFRVPISRDASCRNSPRCVRYSQGYTPGTYAVSVRSRRAGTVSNTLRYTITRSFASTPCSDGVPVCGDHRRALCINGDWECHPYSATYNTDIPYYQDDSGYNPGYSPIYTYNPPTDNYHYSSTCHRPPPACGDWSMVCTRGAWRCISPYRFDNYFSYDDPYHYAPYDDGRYDYAPCDYPRPYCGNAQATCTRNGWRCLLNTPDSPACRPQVACTGPGASCPGGTTCRTFREGYACVPVDCG